MLLIALITIEPHAESESNQSSVRQKKCPELLENRAMIYRLKLHD